MADPKDFTLFSGAATGAEAAFGAAAERWGVKEVNYSFEGHVDARAVGLVKLSPSELARGDVSLSYVGRLMNRVYRDTPLFRKVLQAIWHQVNSAREVFVVGVVLPDGHVKGGTGWGAEFAKLCNKPLHVFDQQRGHWLLWDHGTWKTTEEPVITHPLFCGTGTRSVTPAGAKAVAELFERSFGS